MTDAIRTKAPRRRRRAASRTVAVLVPLTLLGLAALATDRSYETPGNVAAVAVFLAGQLALVALRVGWRRVVLGAVLGWVLVAATGSVLRAAELRYRGERTEAVVTATHGLACDIRRLDGQPLPHAALDSCSTPVGGTEPVVVDRAGWVSPLSASEADSDGLLLGLGSVLGCAALWGRIAADASRTPPARNAARAG